MFIRILPVLFPLIAAAAQPAYQYAYRGADPARWTRSPLIASTAAASTDFSVYPCRATTCTVSRVIADAAGNTYAVGSRSVTTQATEGFVVKLDPAGSTVFLATFGGSGGDAGQAIALDPSGNIYVGGTTSSPDFPLRNALQPAPIKDLPFSFSNGFLLKLSPDGSQILYSTYFGGQVSALAADAGGNLYATGATSYRDFPATSGLPNGPVGGALAGVIGAFVTKVSPTGDKILYSGRISGTAVACGGSSTCFLSTRFIVGDAIAVDRAGNAYIGGDANVTDLPTTPGVLSPTGFGGWVARVNAAGTALDYLTYLGHAAYVITPYASPGNVVHDLAVDDAGNAYVVGATSDPAFPATPGSWQSKYSGPAAPAPYPEPETDAFVAKLNPTGTAMVWATFLGGSSDDSATAVAVDSKGAVYVTGTSSSADFPLTTGPAQGTDFAAVVNAAGSSLTFSARFPAGSVSRTVAIAPDGRLRTADSAGVISSLTLSQPLPARVLGIGNAAGATLTAGIAPSEVVSVYGVGLGPANPAIAQPDSQNQMPVTLAGTQVLFDGVAAPLLYVSQGQVNAVAPGAVSGKSVKVQVVAGGTPSIGYPSVVLESQPAIFMNGGGAAALNQDGRPNSASNPAKFGSIVSIWATGLGRNYLARDGQVATSAQDSGQGTVLVNGESAEVVYAGGAPGMVAGIVQINFRVPAGLNPALYYVTLSLTPSSPTAFISVAP